MICRLLCKPINAEVTKHSGLSLNSVTADVSIGVFELVEAVFDQRHSTASLYGFHLPIENVLPEYTEVSPVALLFLLSCPALYFYLTCHLVCYYSVRQ